MLVSATGVTEFTLKSQQWLIPKFFIRHMIEIIRLAGRTTNIRETGLDCIQNPPVEKPVNFDFCFDVFLATISTEFLRRAPTSYIGVGQNA